VVVLELSEVAQMGVGTYTVGGHKSTRFAKIAPKIANSNIFYN
jgi:hypothetical protein